MSFYNHISTFLDTNSQRITNDTTDIDEINKSSHLNPEIQWKQAKIVGTNSTYLEASKTQGWNQDDSSAWFQEVNHGGVAALKPVIISSIYITKKKLCIFCGILVASFFYTTASTINQIY